MQFWRPVPQALITELLIIRYDTRHPAPDAVGFMVTLDMKMSGSPWSARKLAQWAGWSRWKASQMKDRVDDFSAEWDDGQPLVAATKRPPMSSEYGDIHDRSSRIPASFQPETSHHGHANYKNTTEQEQSIRTEDVETSSVKAQRIDLDQVWNRLEDIRLKARPNSNRTKIGKRRELLRSRVAEHGAEPLLHTWSWWWNSDDQRARFLREGSFSYATLLRAGKLRDYIERAEQWDPTQSPVGGWFDDEDFDECGNLIELKQEHTHTGE